MREDELIIIYTWILKFTGVLTISYTWLIIATAILITLETIERLK